MMVGHKEEARSKLACGKAYGNNTRTESEEIARSLIAALSDEQLLQIMEAMTTQPVP